MPVLFIIALELAVELSVCEGNNSSIQRCLVGSVLGGFEEQREFGLSIDLEASRSRKLVMKAGHESFRNAWNATENAYLQF